MAWPITRDNSFKPDGDAWNELVTALSTDRGNRDGANYTYSNINVIAKTLKVLTNSAGSPAYLEFGRVTTEGRVAVAASASQYLSGSAAGDLVIQSVAQRILMGNTIANFSVASTGVQIQAPDAMMTIRRSNGGTDEKNWDFVAGTSLALRAVNDAYSSASNVMAFSRSGAVSTNAHVFSTFSVGPSGYDGTAAHIHAYSTSGNCAMSIETKSTSAATPYLRFKRNTTGGVREWQLLVTPDFGIHDLTSGITRFAISTSGVATLNGVMTSTGAGQTSTTSFDPANLAGATVANDATAGVYNGGAFVLSWAGTPMWAIKARAESGASGILTIYGRASALDTSLAACFSFMKEGHFDVLKSGAQVYLQDGLRKYRIGTNGAGRLVIGNVTGNVDLMSFGDSGDIRMNIGGTMKQLSVDGSGFVKAA